MEEDAPQVTTDITYNDKENRYEARVTMPNLFDMREYPLTVSVGMKVFQSTLTLNKMNHLRSLKTVQRQPKYEVNFGTYKVAD